MTDSTVYYSALSARGRKGENNDCAVLAVSIACGVSYMKAHKLFEKHGRRKGRGTPTWMTMLVIEELGFELRPLKKHRLAQCKTTRSLAKELPGRGTFLVHSTRHMAAAKDGKLHDWSEGRLKRINTVYRVEKKGRNA